MMMVVEPHAILNVAGWSLFAVAVVLALCLPRWLGPLRDTRRPVTVTIDARP